MSEDTKESIIIAVGITSVITILAIIFGNTGSGFFRNLMVFIVGTIIGTPVAIIGKFIGSLFSNNELYKYGGFIFGALIGVALASALFSNKLETSFVYQCVHNGASKSQCECIYEKMDDKYDNLKSALINPNKEEANFRLESTAQCIKEK